LHDTTIPMIYAGIAYWGVGLPLSVCFGFLLGMQGRGIWLGLVCGLATAAILLMSRWLRRGKLRTQRLGGSRSGNSRGAGHQELAALALCVVRQAHHEGCCCLIAGHTRLLKSCNPPTPLCVSLSNHAQRYCHPEYQRPGIRVRSRWYGP